MKITILLVAWLASVSNAWIGRASSSSFVCSRHPRSRQRLEPSTTQLHLFYRSPAVNVATSRRLFLPENVEKDWSDGTVEFPYTFTVAVGKQPVFTTLAPAKNGTLTIRLMDWKDLNAITDICVREYSTYSVSSAFEPSRPPWIKFTDWLDQITLGPYVKLSMILKIMMDYSSASPKLPKDHVVLVASLCESGNGHEEQIVGMVEVSRQPPLPKRNPPAIPFPLWLKEGYCRIFLQRATQGWITNLLVVPEYRGRGWAKALVMACEGIARSWSTTSIHLHCDASYRVPQTLYRSLGYEPESSSMSSEFSWISNNDDCCQSSIYIVDGVPLLYMCKNLM